MSEFLSTVVRAVKVWPSGARKLLAVIVAMVMAAGTVVAVAIPAYAVTPEAIAPLPTGANLPKALFASGPTIVVGAHRSTDTGGAWTSDETLTTMQESGVWLSAADGKLYGLSSSGRATAYTVSTGGAQSYGLPSGSWTQMNGTWVLAMSGTGAIANDYVSAGPIVPANPPAGALYGSLIPKLGPAGALVWQGTTSDLHSVFSVATTPAQVAGPWLTIDGVKAWSVNATQFVYALDTATGLQLCTRPLTNLAATPACLMVWAGSHASYGADVYVVGASTFVSVVSYDTGATSWYLSNGTTSVAVQVPARSSIDRPFLGDTAYVVFRDADSVPSFRKVNPDGTLSAAFANPSQSVARVWGLAVAPGRVVGADDRDASSMTFPAWSRSVSGSVFGAETALPKRASGLAVSAGRTAVSSSDGLSMLDRGSLKYTFSDAHVDQISGPYVTQPLYDAAFNPYMLVSKADGTKVATFSTWSGVIFGSVYLSFGVGATSDVTRVTVTDLTGVAAVKTVDLPPGSASCSGWVAWNDVVAGTCEAGHAVRVFSRSTGQLVTSKTSTDTLLSITDVGDGYAMVYGTYGSQLWNFAAGDLSSLVDCQSWTVTDGVGHIACASSSAIIWRDYSALSMAAGRVLGWSAPSIFATDTPTWTPEVDVTKPFNTGWLQIKQGTAVVRELAVPASTDGSLRGVSWDGKNTAGTMLTNGTYTAQLVVSGTDGSGLVTSVDGGLPTFQVSRRAPGSFVALTPSRLLDTRISVGAPGVVSAYGVMDLQVAGRGGVPATGVGAVVLNVTVVTPVSPGYVTVYPTGTTAPVASNLNFTPGQVVPNLVVAKIGNDGKVSILNGSAGFAHLVADVAGYFVAGEVTNPGGVTAVVPYRLLDSRVSPGALAPYGTVTVQTAGRGGVPLIGVSAVIVNLTAVTPETAGYLSAYPSGGVVPNSSNVNFTSGQVVPNLAFVKVAPDGSFTVRNGSAGRAHVIADVAGYVLDGEVVGSGMFKPVDPTRALDTRTPAGGGPLAAYGVKTLPLAGSFGVGSPVSGVVVNVTVVSGVSGGYLTVYPADAPQIPLASNLNFGPAGAVPNLVAAKTSTAGAIAIYNGSSSGVHVIVDVAGYFTA